MNYYCITIDLDVSLKKADQWLPSRQSVGTFEDAAKSHDSLRGTCDLSSNDLILIIAGKQTIYITSVSNYFLWYCKDRWFETVLKLAHKTQVD